jgi:hypothetical protein
MSDPYSFTGTVPFFNATELHATFMNAPVLRVSLPLKKSSGDVLSPVSLPYLSTAAPPTPATFNGLLSSADANGTTPTSNVRVTKVGLLSRKDDLVEGGKKVNWRKWKQWTVILTSSQLLFFVRLL